MPKSNRYSRLSCKTVYYPQKEPKKPKLVVLPEEHIDILDQYETIDCVPKEKVSEYLQAILDQ